VRVTRQLLRDVGVCGTYLRRFSDLFPAERYPEGVELNREVCAANADDFDWHWAASEFLNWEGRQELDTLVRSRSAEARAFGTGTVKQAAIFGHLFDTREDYRNPRVVELARTADERADAEATATVARARTDVADARRQLEYWTAELPRREARVPELEAFAAGATRRAAARAAERAAAEVAQLEERLETLRRAAAEAATALAALPTEEPAPAAEAPAEPVPAEVS
jgi:hypothetical protein